MFADKDKRIKGVCCERCIDLLMEQYEEMPIFVAVMLQKGTQHPHVNYFDSWGIAPTEMVYIENTCVEGFKAVKPALSAMLE
jgi:hypothetical protein